MSEGVGVFITYFFVWLSQGQQYETGICLALNWIGLQLESFVLKYVKPNLTETGYNTLCGTFCGLNFLLFVLFNSIAFVGLSTAQVFSFKLSQQGKMHLSQSDIYFNYFQEFWTMVVILTGATFYGNTIWILERNAGKEKLE